MVGKKTSKRSTLYNKGTNATLDQFFTKKNKTIENDSSIINENDNKNLAPTSSDISKQQQQPTKKLLSPSSKSLPTDNKTESHNNTKQTRRPLADISGKSTQALTMLPTTRPAKPSFTVLRDDDIEQGVTEADKQTHIEPSIPLSPPRTDESTVSKQQTETIENNDTTTEDADDDDTQDSQTSSLGQPISSPDSFFDENNEFRLDTLDSDDDDDDNDNDNSDDNHTTTSTFFDDDDDDDDDEPPFLTKTHRRIHLPTTSKLSIPNKRSLENESDNHDNKMIKNNHSNNTNASLPSTSITKETDDQGTKSTSTLKFSFDKKDNDQSILNDIHSPLPLSSSSSAAQTPEAILSSQQKNSESSTYSQSSRLSELSTLPMSLPIDESVDLHVAYPVPRGKQVIDKFGQ